MKIISNKVSFETNGNCDIIDITAQVGNVLEWSKIKNGILNVFAIGATAAVTTIEYEPGLIADLQNFLKKIIPESGTYQHNMIHCDGNAHSHLRASFLGPSLTVPIENCKMILGTWQQIVFIDMDNRPRSREIIVKIIGE